MMNDQARRERKLERQRAWRSANPQLVAAQLERRYAKKRAATAAARLAARPPGDWRAVPGFEGYFADQNGRILGLKGRVLAPSFVDGYARVHMKGKNYMVHRIVMLTFEGPCPLGSEVNHRNGMKGDNRRSNLEYVTKSQNIRHSLDVLGRIRARGEANGTSWITEEMVHAMRALYDAGGVTTRDIGVAFGVDRSHARRICTRQSWRHI